MTVVVYSRKRRIVKNRLKHTGRGIFLAAALVIITTFALPWLLPDKNKPLEQMTFADLLKVAADQAPQITETTFFSLDIPKIKAKAKIIPNVASGDKFEYTQALIQGVAHSAGTFLPGMAGSMTLFSHSTDIAANISRYNAVFYRLDELKPGDQVIIWYLGKKYDYRVTGTKITGPKDVSVFIGESGESKLYLVTCTPRGTTKNRLIVEAMIQ
ncbi:MAG: class E sortase [Patescibacteria group bacterium]